MSVETKMFDVKHCCDFCGGYTAQIPYEVSSYTFTRLQANEIGVDVCINCWPAVFSDVINLKSLRTRLAAAEAVVEAVGFYRDANCHGEDCPKGDPDHTAEDECECGADLVREKIAAFDALQAKGDK